MINAFFGLREDGGAAMESDQALQHPLDDEGIVPLDPQSLEL